MKNYVDGCECMECRDARKFEEIMRKDKERQMINSEMTRNQAIQKLAELWFTRGDENPTYGVVRFVDGLESLGIVKFKAEPEIKKLCEFPQYKDYGHVSIEEWPEGLVLWVGGEIVYKSWVNK